jgi:hypothetical protein
MFTISLAMFKVGIERLIRGKVPSAKLALHGCLLHQVVDHDLLLPRRMAFHPDIKQSFGINTPTSKLEK